MKLVRFVGFLLFALVAVAPTYAAAPAKPIITFVHYDGQEYRTEGDEYVVIKNAGGTALDLKGFMINAGDKGQNFVFPTFALKPGASVKVYTNRRVKGSFSFSIGKAIWNNKGDCGYLFNAARKQVSEYCY